MGGSSVLAIVLLGVVAATLLALLVGGNLGLTGDLAVDLTLVPDPDYAYLAPAPDSIIWSEGQERTLLVRTDRDDVEMRTDSLAMGIEAVKGSIPYSGELITLGASFGCQDWAVSKLWADGITSTGYTLRGNVARNNYEDTATVYYRFRFSGGAWRTTGDVDVAGPADDSFAIPSTTSGGVWEVEASGYNTFPPALTRRIVIDQNQETATTDEGVESIVLPKDTAVVLQACSEHDDLTLTLHGHEDEELHRYVVDIGPPFTATPTPTPPPATPFPGYRSIRVCVDEAEGQFGYLSGGELVGGVLDPGFFDLTNVNSAELADITAGEGFYYFFDHTLASNEVQLTVSDLGASDLGLKPELVYTVRLTVNQDEVADSNPNDELDDSIAAGTASIDLGVWLDTTTLSPAGDGSCS